MDLSGTAATGSGASRAYGVSLLNDSKYGFDCLGSDLRMSLLRSPIFCFHDPAQVEADRDYLYMDQGPQTLHYSLLPHTGDWREGGSALQAHALNNPLQTLFQYPHPGDWGPAGSLLEVTPSHVIAAALKGAEDGPDIILRLFESQGRPAPATVTLPGNRRFEIPMAAWELKTLRISPSGAIREVNLLEE